MLQDGYKVKCQGYHNNNKDRLAPSRVCDELTTSVLVVSSDEEKFEEEDIEEENDVIFVGENTISSLKDNKLIPVKKYEGDGGSDYDDYSGSDVENDDNHNDDDHNYICKEDNGGGKDNNGEYGSNQHNDAENEQRSEDDADYSEIDDSCRFKNYDNHGRNGLNPIVSRIALIGNMKSSVPLQHHRPHHFIKIHKRRKMKKKNQCVKRQNWFKNIRPKAINPVLQ